MVNCTLLRVSLSPLVIGVLACFTLPETARAQQAGLDLQEKCAARAKKVFTERELKAREFTIFSNHYNVKLGRCLLEIVQEMVPDSSGYLWTFRDVTDAFEGKTFATYIWRNDKTKKYWEVSPFVCTVRRPSGEEVTCSSSEEFDTLIKDYME